MTLKLALFLGFLFAVVGCHETKPDDQAARLESEFVALLNGEHGAFFVEQLQDPGSLTHGGAPESKVTFTSEGDQFERIALESDNYWEWVIEPSGRELPDSAVFPDSSSTLVLHFGQASLAITRHTPDQFVLSYDDLSSSEPLTDVWLIKLTN